MYQHSPLRGLFCIYKKKWAVLIATERLMVVGVNGPGYV